MKKRFWSILMVLVLCAGLLPTAARAAVPTQPGMLSYLRYYNNDSRGVQSYSPTNGYHYVYLGQWDNEPIKWRVLEIQDEDSTSSKLFLLADECLGDSMLFNPAEKQNRYLWQESDVQKWCGDTFYNGAFTNLERKLILATDKTDKASSSADMAKTGGMSFGASELQGETVFAPSWEEITNASYGFTNGEETTVYAKAVDSSTMSISQTGMTYNGGKTDLLDPDFDKPTGTISTIITYAGTLHNGSSYAATADKPTQAGSYTVTVTCETADTIYTASAPFAIAPIDLEDGKHGVGFSSPKIRYSGTEDYTGIYPLGPREDPQMTKNKDYTITGDVTATNVGKYTVYINGIGNNYIGTMSGEWEIIPAVLTVTGVTAVKPYDGTTTATVTEVSFKGLQNGEMLTTADYTVTDAAYSDANAGADKIVTGKITLNATNTAKNYELKSSDFSVSTGEIKQATVSAKESGALTVANNRARNYTFDFKALLPVLEAGKSYGTITYGEPDVQLTVGYYTKGAKVENGVLTLPIAGKITNEEGSIGTVKVKVTTENYADMPLTLNVSASNKIVPLLEGALTLTPAKITYGDQLSKIAISGTMKDDDTVVPGTFTWAAPDTVLTVGTHENIAWTFTPDDGVQYAEATGTATVTVDKATPTGTPRYTAITVSGKTLGDAVLTVGSITPAGGTITWDLGNDQSVAANTAYSWTYTPADSDNYNNLTGSITPYVVRSGGSHTPTYPINVPSKTENGSVTVSPKNASKGTTVTITVKPDSGYELETITATDKNGNELKLTDKGNGKYIFTMPAGRVDVNATFMEDNSLLNFFYDVPNGAYYYEAVKWAVENGITGGIGNNLFGPDQPCTRAQIVTFLWCAAGSPEPKAMSSFSDVPADSYYAKAVAWGVENSITTGTSDDMFSPDATCTRAQAVTFLARALNAKADNKAEFSDVPIDSYFAEAVAWAAANGVTTGIGGGLFGPNNNCTRAQIVTFLWRAYNK